MVGRPSDRGPQWRLWLRVLEGRHARWRSVESRLAVRAGRRLQTGRPRQAASSPYYGEVRPGLGLRLCCTILWLCVCRPSYVMAVTNAPPSPLKEFTFEFQESLQELLDEKLVLSVSGRNVN